MLAIAASRTKFNSVRRLFGFGMYGHGQQFGVDIQWRLKAQHLARARVESVSDGLQVFIAVDGEIGALGQVLAQQAVGVLVAAALRSA